MPGIGMDPPTIRVSLTGTPRIEQAGVITTAANLGRREWLAFAVLVVARGPTPQADLAEIVWDDAPPPTWPAALRTVVSGVRRFLGQAGLSQRDILVTRNGCYVLRLPTPTILDIDLDPRMSEARQALEEHDPGRAASLATSIVQVADAPFLPGSEGAWVEMVRQRLQRRRTTALGVLAEAALLAGDQALAVANAETALAADPLDETFHRLLMQAHAASGNRAQALLAYARCRELLADELGTDPAPETEGIYLEILRMGPVRTHKGANADLFVPPPTHFVRFGSERIPYQVLGEGTRDLLITGGSFSNVDSVWHHPASANVFRCLTGAGRVIQFDRWGGGGAGLPQAGGAGGAQELRAWAEVFQVVLDAAESRETALLATLDGGPPAIHFTVHAGERVRRLVLINTTARWLTATDYPPGLSAEQARHAIQWIEDHWGTEAFAAEMYPSEAEDQEFLRWYAANQRALARPEIAAAWMRGLGAIDVRSLLRRIRVPTLVVHRKDHLAFPLAQGQYLAQHIPNARFLELPGRGGLFGADSQDLAQSVLAFLCE